MSSSIQQDVSSYHDNESTYYIMDDSCSRIRHSLYNDGACIEAARHSEYSTNGVGLFTLALMKILAGNTAKRARKRLKKRFIINPQNPYKVSGCIYDFRKL